MKVNSFSDFNTGRHTARPSYCLCWSLAVLIDLELKGITMNPIPCHVHFMPGTLSQRVSVLITLRHDHIALPRGHPFTPTASLSWLTSTWPCLCVVNLLRSVLSKFSLTTVWLMERKGNKSGDKKSSYIITGNKRGDDKDVSYGSCQVCLKSWGRINVCIFQV